MKAIIINTTYNIGSTGKLSFSLNQALNTQNNDSILCFGTSGIKIYNKVYKIQNLLEQKIHSILGRITGMHGCFSNAATNRLIEIIKKFNPDIIYCGNLHGHYLNIYKFFEYIKKAKIPCVQILWDEYMMTGSCSFSYDCIKYENKCYSCPRIHEYPISWFFDTSKILQKKKEKAYDNPNLVFVSVPHTIKRAKKSMLLKNKKLIALDESVDQINQFYPRETSKLRKELNISEKTKIILNVCVYSNERKGGKYFLELARKCENIKDLAFIHVGFSGDVNDCPSNFIPIGFEKDQNQLAEYYSLADLFVCTSFAETQPNTCLEALSCGTPICGFNISGIPTCADAPFGTYVEPANIDELMKVVMAAQKRNENSIKEVRVYACSRFSSVDYNNKLIEIGKNLIKSIGKT